MVVDLIKNKKADASISESSHKVSDVSLFCAAVWLGIMLPVLGTKSLSAYAIGYLERLLL